MRKKISRILGVALAVMLLTSLMVGFAVAPASAAEGKWNALRLPAAGGPGGFVYNPVFTNAMYITQGIDGTLYCYDNDATGNPYLFKSSDGGYSWARCGTAASAIAGLVLVDIVADPQDANIVWVATATTAYKSTNGGTTFTAMVANAALAGTHVITALDVAYIGGSAYVFIGTADGAGLYGGVYVIGPAYGANWADLQVNNQAAQFAGDDFTITGAVAADNGLITIGGAIPNPQDIAVTTTGAGNYTAATGAWTAGIGDTVVVQARTNGLVGVWTRTTANATAAITTDVDLDCAIVAAGGAWNLADGTGRDILDLRAAPDFGTSQVVVAIATDEINTWSTTKYGGANWGANVADAMLGAAVIAINADIAFSANFDSVTTSGLMEYFIGVDTGGADTGDVWRVVLANAFDRNISGAGTTTDITSIDVKGDVGAAHIIAGKADNLVGGVAVAFGTRYSADNGATWTLSKKHPVGATWITYVVMDNDFLNNTTAWAATSGAGGGVYRAVDGLEWNGVGLLFSDITGAGSFIQDFAVGVGSETVFVSINNAAGNDVLWRYDGTNWEQVYADQLGLDCDMVAVTDTYGTDTTVFIGDLTGGGAAGLRIARSTDGGDRWTNQLTAVPAAFGATPESWLIQGPSELLVGNNAVNGNIYQTINNGTTWNARACSIAGASIASIKKSPEYATDSTVVAGTTAGFVVRSVNTGSNWAQIPAGAAALVGAGNTFVTFNGANAEQVFAVTTAGGNSFVYRYNFGDAGWSNTITNVANTAPPPPAVAGGVLTPSVLITAGATGIVSSPDGALYVADVGAGLGASRSINPEAALTPVGSAPFFEPLNPAGSGLPGGTITAVGPLYTPGSNKIWIADSLAGGGTAINRLYYYEDGCVEGPVNLNAVNIGQTFASLTWDALDGATRYIVHYNQTALGWAGATQLDSTTNGLAIAPATLISGTDYHFRVAVHDQSPALSRWAASFDFSTEMGAAQWSPFPAAGNFSPVPGAKDVDPIEPLFQWNPSTGSTGYEFQLSDNAAYAGADTKKVKSPTYAWPGDLEYGKTYYWRVRAYTADGKFSEWASGIFTTAGEPVPSAPPAPAPAPPAPAPVIVPQAIPSFLLWTIVGIGAVLLIALIWLIMKTRRVS